MPDDAMARGDDRNGIAAVRRAHRAHRGGIAELFGNLAVIARLAIRDLEQRSPHAALEVGAPEFERQVELAARAREIFAELAGGLA